MNLLERRDTRLPFPELIEWLENPMFGFRPFGQIVRVEEYIADHRYVVRAELPGIDPDKDVEITIDGGALHIRAEKTRKAAEAHRTRSRRPWSPHSCRVRSRPTGRHGG